MDCPNKLFWFTLHYDVPSVSYLANTARVSVVSILSYGVRSLRLVYSLWDLLYVTSFAHAPECMK